MVTASQGEFALWSETVCLSNIAQQSRATETLSHDGFARSGRLSGFRMRVGLRNQCIQAAVFKFISHGRAAREFGLGVW